MFTSTQAQETISFVFTKLRCLIRTPRESDFTFKENGVISPFQCFLLQVATCSN